MRAVQVFMLNDSNEIIIKSGSHIAGYFNEVPVVGPVRRQSHAENVVHADIFLTSS